MYVENKNIKEFLIEMKTICLWLCMSVDNETFSLKLRLQLLVSLLETEMVRSFCKTFSSDIWPDCSNIRQQLCSFLGSAVNIRPKPPAPQDNCFNLLNFKGATQKHPRKESNYIPVFEEWNRVRKNTKTFWYSAGLEDIFTYEVAGVAGS